MTTKELAGMPKILEKAEHYIYIAAGFILIVAAGGFIIIGVIEMGGLVIHGDYVRAMVQLLDRILLVLNSSFCTLPRSSSTSSEVVYTIGRITRTQMLEVEPFLIVGTIAAVRRMLIITAEASGHVKIDDPTFLAALAEMGVLSLMIFLLALAMRLLRAKKSVD